MAKTSKLRTSANYSLKDADLETGGGISLTLPDHSMSVQEIYNRYATGRPISASQRIPVYHGEEQEFPDTKKLDLAEIGEMLQNVRENRALLEHQTETELQLLRDLEKEKQLLEKKEEDERLLKLYEERRNAQKHV